MAYVLGGGEIVGEVSDLAGLLLEAQQAEQEEGEGDDLRAQCLHDLPDVLKTLLVLSYPDPQRCSVIASQKVVTRRWPTVERTAASRS